MRIAIFALTVAGRDLALRLAEKNPEDCVDIFLSARLFSRQIENENHGRVWRFTKVREALTHGFAIYDAIVCIMATGIVVRSLAPLLQDKLHDPAVVVFDERGRHGISLLSGHLGGANALTKQLCASIGADPVITTATDTEQLKAPDALAERIHLRPWPKERILFVNRSLLDGQQVVWQIDANMRHAEFYRQCLQANKQHVEIVSHVCTQAEFKAGNKVIDRKLQASKDAQAELVIYLTDKQAERMQIGVALYMFPQRLIAGVGCRKDVPKELVHKALRQAAASVGVNEARIDCLASTTHKAQERGLLRAAEDLQIPCHFFDNEKMSAVIAKYHLPESAFVLQTLGIGNVCEAAALAELNGRSGRFALVKTKFEKVTVSLLWEKSQ